MLVMLASKKSKRKKNVVKLLVLKIKLFSIKKHSVSSKHGSVNIVSIRREKSINTSISSISVPAIKYIRRQSLKKE